MDEARNLLESHVAELLNQGSLNSYLSQPRSASQPAGQCHPNPMIMTKVVRNAGRRAHNLVHPMHTLQFGGFYVSNLVGRAGELHTLKQRRNLHAMTASRGQAT